MPACQHEKGGDMTLNRYTQFLLTVIALCLVFLCAKDFVSPPKAQAQSEGPVHVVLVDEYNRPISSSPAGLYTAQPGAIKVAIER
jgi:hypothetical protein